MGNASALAGLLLLFGAATASPANAQTTTVDGAYAKLSPGNAKIARALYEAQVTPTPTTGSASRTTTTSSTATSTTTPKTLDQIAAMKANGQGWGQIFQTMKAQGLVIDKNLGQVVSRYQHRSSTSGVVTAASNRTGGVASHGAGKSDDGGVSASYDDSGNSGKGK